MADKKDRFKVTDYCENIDLKSLYEINNSVFVIKLCILVALGYLFVWLLGSTSGVYKIICQLSLGALFAHALELQHQCLHYTAFTVKPANRIAGIMLGLPMLTAYSDFQRQHSKHHVFSPTPLNTEFFSYQYHKLSLRKPTDAINLLIHFSNIRHYLSAITKIFRAFALDWIFIKKTQQPEHKEYLFIGISIISLAIFSGISGLLDYWLIPLLFGGIIHTMIELPEHLHCDTTTDNVFYTSRSIKTNALMRWFVNGNNYHTEHHFLPAVPAHRLDELHALLKGSQPYYQPSYIHFYIDFFKNISVKA